MESSHEIGIRDVVAEGGLSDLVGMKDAVGSTETASGIIDELQRFERLCVRPAAFPDAETQQEGDGLVEERGASAFRSVGGRAFGGVHDGGRKSLLQASKRRSKPGRASANDNDIRLIQLTHASPLFCPTAQIYPIVSNT